MVKNKTWKREMALLFCVVLTHQIYLNNTSMVEVIIWPLVSFIAAAAGLHIYDKNSNPTVVPSKLQPDK